MMRKPFKGEIHKWCRIRSPLLTEGLGFKIVGIPVGHPTIFRWILTSEVMKMSEDYRIETLNSEYLLVGEETCTPLAQRFLSLLVSH